MMELKSTRPPIDIQEALERAMGEKDFLAMLLEEFSASLSAQIEQLRAAIAKRDGATLAEQSHTLKGAAGNLSAKAMAAVVLRLEKAGQGGDFQASSGLVDEVEREAQRLRLYLDRIDWSNISQR